MLTFSKFITEQHFFLSEESVSDISGKMHENLVHKELMGGKHPSHNAEIEHDNLKSRITSNEYNNAVARAKHAANHIRKHIIGNKKVVSIERTSKPGQTGESQSDNTSDLVIHYTGKKKHGLSLKTARTYGAKVPVSNPGLGTLKKYTGVDSAKHYKSALAELHRKHPHTAGMSTSKLNNEIKNNPKVADSAKEIGDKHLKNTLQQHAKGIKKMSSQDRANFIKKEVLRNAKTLFPVSKVETSGSGNKITTSHADQDSHDHILNDHTNISHRVSGNSIVFSHPSHGDFAAIRFKYTSRFGSAIKGSGELKGKKIAKHIS
jgi:hypothetical protein